MVRLKEKYFNKLNESSQEFQFLMVRLKFVCIPVKKRRKHISIPYGAIKSIIFDYNSLAKPLFQFLMVRLKV